MYKGSLSDPGEQHFSRDAGRGGAVKRADSTGLRSTAAAPTGNAGLKDPALKTTEGVKTSSAAAKQANPKPAPKPAKPIQSKREQERERKNKGAPKWLKAKRDGDQQ